MRRRKGPRNKRGSFVAIAYEGNRGGVTAVVVVVVFTPSCVSGTVSVARFSEGPHLLLGAIYLIREPLSVYPSPPLLLSLSLSFYLSTVPRTAAVCCPGPKNHGMLGISACFYENGLRLPRRPANDVCMASRSTPGSVLSSARALVPRNTGHGQRRARARVGSRREEPRRGLFLPSKKSERENGDKSVEAGPKR